MQFFQIIKPHALAAKHTGVVTEGSQTVGLLGAAREGSIPPPSTIEREEEFFDIFTIQI